MNDKLMWEAPCGCIVEITGDWWHGDGFVIEEVYIEHYCQKDKWISVKDSFPEDERQMELFAVVRYGSKDNGFVDCRRFCCDQCWLDDGVTHWMPLPEPPKENDDRPVD